uniref:Transcriptional regulator n=1 Tax=OCS116 cluster bacterium TaxID=2030921 RepID=A0A2A4Z6K3_9PROT
MTETSPKPTGKLAALSRQRLGDQIADALRNQILLGELQPGNNIPERETAAALGVSRTPLREALVILEGEGLVSMSPARSPRVSNPSLESLTHLLYVQSALEALAGECACDEMTDEEFKYIESLNLKLQAMSETAEPIDFFTTDMAFHEAIVAATKNAPLIKTHKQYNARLWRVRFMSSRKRIKRLSTLEDHSAIVEGLRNRDKQKTSAVLSHHLRTAIVNITSIFDQENQSN